MIQSFLSNFAAACGNQNFFSFPTWYKYLEQKTVGSGDSAKCVVEFSLKEGSKFNGDDILLVILAIIDILIRIAGLVALAFILVGGIKYITSQGSPEGTKNAKDTIFNAILGLLIAIIAASVVAFIGRTLK